VRAIHLFTVYTLPLPTQDTDYLLIGSCSHI
jgi:hypothetical protein